MLDAVRMLYLYHHVSLIYTMQKVLDPVPLCLIVASYLGNLASILALLSFIPCHVSAPLGLVISEINI
jgi:hypothetical protein